jgi:hypothetical protein
LASPWTPRTIVGDAGPGARSLSVQLGIKDGASLPVSLQDVLELVAEHEPVVVDSVVTERHRYHRCGIVEPEAHAIDLGSRCVPKDPPRDYRHPSSPPRQDELVQHRTVTLEGSETVKHFPTRFPMHRLEMGPVPQVFSSHVGVTKSPLLKVSRQTWPDSQGRVRGVRPPAAQDWATHGTVSSFQAPAEQEARMRPAPPQSW